MCKVFEMKKKKKKTASLLLYDCQISRRSNNKFYSVLLIFIILPFATRVPTAESMKRKIKKKR